MEPKLYPYSKNTAITLILLLLAFTVGGLFTLKTIRDTRDIIAAVISGLLMLTFLTFFIAKFLIPALQNKTAIEISSSGIINYFPKTVKIDWKDVEEIQLTALAPRNMFITFKQSRSEGRRGIIGLFRVEGNSREIYDTAVFYFQNSKKVI